MDATAYLDLHSALRAEGFVGSLAKLRELLLQAEQDAKKRLVLKGWGLATQPLQHAALVAAYAHADKHRMQVAVRDGPNATVLVFAREREFRGVTLGALNVSETEVRWRFYREGEYVGDRTTLGVASRTRATRSRRQA